MEPKAKLGPKMKALPNDLWRATVVEYVEGGVDSNGGNASRGYVAAMRRAGWGEKMKDASMRAYSARLFHDTRFQEAIVEEAKRRLITDLPSALEIQRQIMRTPGHKDAFAAARSIQDRAGLHAVVEERHIHEVTFDAPRAVMLAKRLGIPLDKFVGQRAAARIAHGTIVDAEFEEIEDQPDICRLEDLI